jgi:adhesin/invasin
VRGVRRFGSGAIGLAVAVAILVSLASPAAALAVARPVVTAVSPANGSTLGGTTVTIHGKHFTVGGRSVVKKVLFGTTAATSVKVKSAVLLTVRAPRRKGTVNVRVVTKGGTSAVVKADRFVFKGAMPVVAGVSPAYGPTTGGTTVTITGAGFTGATGVTFGSVVATSFKVMTATTITAITPQHPGLAWDVRVTTPSGTSAVPNLAGKFTFYAPATVISVSPANGPRAGGTTVTITGSNLFSARSVSQAVKFGNVPATAVVVKSDAVIQATAPAGTGTADVTVTTLAGATATSSADQFSYAAQIAAAPTSPTNQSQVVGFAVGTPPSVVVTDALGHPVQGVSVTFAVTGGGGSATGITVTTNVSGVATVGSWTLGTLAISNTLTATSAGLSGSPLTFNATGLPNTATHIAVNAAGSVQTATVGGPVATLPSVVVTDAGGNRVPNVPITFTVTSGGGSATGTTVSTDSTGIATVGSWTLGPAVGTNTLTASGANLAGSPVTFTATGTVGVAKNIALHGGDGQTVDAGTAVATPPSVLVTDAHGNPVAGVSVAFSVFSGGGSAAGTPALTNASGIATVGSWALGTTPGPNTLRATVTGLSGSPVIFSATGNVGAAATIAANGGDGQSATVGTAVSTDPSVLVTDGFNNPVQGVNVTFSVASGGGSVGGGNATTNASGIATVGSWVLGGTPGPNSLQATATGLSGSPVTFSATGKVGAAATIAANGGDGQSATVGTAVATDPSVLVTDTHGNPVQGVSVTFSVASGGGSVSGGNATTNASGIATVGSWTLGGTSGPNSLQATATGLAGSPVTFGATGKVGAAATIALNDGDGQTATVGTAVATDPSVLVTDTHGNPVQGVSVTFSVASGAGSVTGGNATTNASGIATVGSWTLGDTAGANTLQATSGSLSGSPVTFSAAGAVGQAATIAVNDGDGQSATAGTAVATPPSVLVTDAHGNPVSGVAVTFAVDLGNGTATDTAATTDASGIAAVSSWTLGDPGLNTLTATAGGLAGSPLTFTATGL